MYSFDEETGLLQLTRGDSLYIPILITDEETGEPVAFEDVERVTMTVREDRELNAPVLLQKYADTDMIHLLPADTQALGWGTYYYDVELRFNTGDVYTYGPCKFKLLKEVTY